MRAFYLVRDEDVSGVSGTGEVAKGVEFSDGTCVLTWEGEVTSLIIYKNLADLERIHGHGGKTRVVTATNDQGEEMRGEGGPQELTHFFGQDIYVEHVNEHGLFSVVFDYTKKVEEAKAQYEKMMQEVLAVKNQDQVEEGEENKGSFGTNLILPGGHD